MNTAGPGWSSLDEDDEDWQRPAGIFVLAPISGGAVDAIQELQRRYDPKLAAAHLPHVTVAGSSGVGPIHAGTSIEELRRHLAPIAATTPVLTLALGLPQRFMQTRIISLPMDPHGPMRALHDRIARSGLQFDRARFTFTPHITLNLHRTLSRDMVRELLAVRISEPVTLDRLLLSATDDPYPPQALLELPFGAAAPPAPTRSRD